MPSRGEVVWVSLARARGSEQEKRRPAVVVSNDAANRSAVRHQRGVITVVPLTSSRPYALDHQVALEISSTGLARHSVAQIEQVRAIDINRVETTGRLLPSPDLRAIGQALAVHLGLR